MLKQLKAFTFGCVLTGLILSVCLNVHQYRTNKAMGYTESQREQMDALYKRFEREESNG